MIDFKDIAKKNIADKSQLIINFGRKVFSHAEMGFQEFNTHKEVKDIFKQIDLKIESPLAVTGIKGIIKGGHPGPTIAIMGEMDGLSCSDHPEANPETGAAHICGHNAQLAAMIGAAYGLADRRIQNDLHGNIVFIATPAEEYVNIEERLKLRDSAKIGFLAGKPELIREGVFDEVDIALITHVGSNIPGKRFGLGGSANGFMAKSISFIGKASHAGGAPEKGRNALQAANLAINAINAWRETFEDDACIRVHPIITSGGDLVNIVPSDVKMETYIRGKNLQQIMETNKKIDRAIQAGAMAMGCKAIIKNTPGFLPQYSSKELVVAIRENAELLLDKEKIIDNGHFTGSADMGDLTQLIPGTIIEVGGVTGSPHTKDFGIVDEEMAYILPAKLLAFTAIDLLAGSPQKANNIISSYKANLTKDEYINFVEGLFSKSKYDYSF